MFILPLESDWKIAAINQCDVERENTQDFFLAQNLPGNRWKLFFNYLQHERHENLEKLHSSDFKYRLERPQSPNLITTSLYYDFKVYTGRRKSQSRWRHWNLSNEKRRKKNFLVLLDIENFTRYSFFSSFFFSCFPLSGESRQRQREKAEYCATFVIVEVGFGWNICWSFSLSPVLSRSFSFTFNLLVLVKALQGWRRFSPWKWFPSPPLVTITIFIF